METNLSADDLTRELARQHRVLLLGGLAVIAHGHTRPTKDADIWLEPLSSPEEWARICLAAVSLFPKAYFWSLAEKRKLEPEDVPAEVSDVGVVRIGGLDVPLDVFRKPNELEIEEFDAVWASARELKHGLRLPHVIDLYKSKANTGRDHDWKDQLFLEKQIKELFRERLSLCDLVEAQSLLSRFMVPEVLQFAKDNPSKEVRDLALKYLREFAAEGDPYSRDILAEWKEE